jgi:hypothetical protein
MRTFNFRYQAAICDSERVCARKKTFLFEFFNYIIENLCELYYI